MERVLGLDVGDRRVGFAFGNQLGVGSSMVVPGGFLAVTSIEDAVRQAARLAEDEGVETIVVGLPQMMGGDTGQTRKVRKFVEGLQAALPKVALHFWDETLTSFGAREALKGAELKHSGKSKRGREDAVAACLILQGYLDSRRGYGGV